MRDTIVRISGQGFNVKLAFEFADQAEEFLKSAYEASIRQNDDQVVEFSIYEDKE